MHRSRHKENQVITFTQTYLEPRQANGVVAAWAVGYDLQENDDIAYAETLLEVDEDQQKALDDWSDAERDQFITETLGHIGWLDNGQPAGEMLDKLRRLQTSRNLANQGD
jgi:hypothetical protein